MKTVSTFRLPETIFMKITKQTYKVKTSLMNALIILFFPFYYLYGNAFEIGSKGSWVKL